MDHRKTSLTASDLRHIATFFFSVVIAFVGGCGGEKDQEKGILYAPVEIPVAAEKRPVTEPEQETSEEKNNTTEVQIQADASVKVDRWEPAPATTQPEVKNTNPIDDPAGLLKNSPPPANGQERRPIDIASWTADQVLDAIREDDVQVTRVVEMFKKRSRGSPKAVDQYQEWIMTMAGNEPPKTSAVSVPGNGALGGYGASTTAKPSAGFSGPTPTNTAVANDSPRYQIAKSILEGLADNGTSPAFALIQRISTGQTKIGIGDDQGEELAMNVLLQHFDNPHNTAQDVLNSALKTRAAQQPINEQTREAVDRAIEIYLGLFTATMQATLGISEDDASRAPFGNISGFTGGASYGAAPISSWNDRASGQPDQITMENISLEREDALALQKIVWDDETVGLMTQLLESSPDPLEGLLLAGQIPLPRTRVAVRDYFKRTESVSPTGLVERDVFGQYLLDPAVHVFLKSQAREQRAAFESRSRRSTSKDRELSAEQQARLEARFGWFDASEQSLFGWLDRMAHIAMLGNSLPYHPDEVPFEILRTSEIKASHRIQLPLRDSADSEVRPARTTINYIRIEVPSLEDRSVSHYRNVMRDVEEKTILNGSAVWFDRDTRERRDTGTLQSVDVVISKNNSRAISQGQNFLSGSPSAIEILITEIENIDATEELKAE